MTQLSLDDASRAARRARRRGQRGERQVIEILHTFGWLRAHRNLDQPQYGKDIADGPAGTRLSVKLTERLKLREAFAECAEHARAAGEIPIVAHRSNNQPWLATVELSTLLRLLRSQESE